MIRIMIFFSNIDPIVLFYRLGPIYQKVHRTTAALEFFTTNQWIYRTENFQALNEELSPEDKVQFLIDVKQIDWADYMHKYVLGIRHFLLKEDPSTIASAKFKLDLIYYATQVAKLSVAGVSGYTAYKVLSSFRRNK